MFMFDAKKTKDDLVKWIREWFNTNGKGCNAIVGISGGKDSTIVAALCAEALGKDRVIGILMPNGRQSDIEDAHQVVNKLRIRWREVNIYPAVEHIQRSVSDNVLELRPATTINLPARIRMATLYAFAQSLEGRVVNTCNLSEDWIGYSTKYGDAAGDFSPLANLTVTEVMAIGDELGIPFNLVHKTPSDGLCGKSDEDRFGFTYAVLDEYIRTGKCADSNIKASIDKMHRDNQFKLKPMESFPYEA